MAAGPGLLRELLTEYDELSRTISDTRGATVGRDRLDIERALVELGIEPVEELLIWWGWSDGGIGEPRNEQLSLDDAIELYRWHVEQPSSQWDRNWMPVVGDRRTSIAVRCVASSRPPLVRAVDYEFGASTDANVTDFQVESLCTVVARWVTAIRSGWYLVDASGHVRVDQVAIPEAWLRSQIY